MPSLENKSVSLFLKKHITSQSRGTLQWTVSYLIPLPFSETSVVSIHNQPDISLSVSKWGFT